MIRPFILSMACGVAFLMGCSQRSEPTTLRVMTYNMHHGQGEDDKLDLERIAEVIRRAEPDLVALQEVDRGTERTGRVDQPARLAALTGLQVVFEKNIPLQGGEYGNAVLSRLPILEHQNHLLPGSPSSEQRGALEVHLRLDSRPLVFLATHFDHRPPDGERLASMATLRERVARYSDRPVIVAGDLNAEPDSAVLAAAAEFLEITRPDDLLGCTYPADRPAKRIDYVLHNHHPGVRSVSLSVLPEAAASDHRPVLAIFEIDPRGGGDK